MNARWTPIDPVLRDFEAYLSPNAPRLELVEACCRAWSDDEYKRLRPKGFPGTLRGVYLMFNEADALEYVGLAMWCFDKRVWTHDDHVERHWTDIIPFPDSTVFLAPALEFFLISKLHPPRNRQYRGYEIAPLD